MFFFFLPSSFSYFLSGSFSSPISELLSMIYIWWPSIFAANIFKYTLPTLSCPVSPPLKLLAGWGRYCWVPNPRAYLNPWTSTSNMGRQIFSPGLAKALSEWNFTTFSDSWEPASTNSVIVSLGDLLPMDVCEKLIWTLLGVDLLVSITLLE